MKNYFKVVTLAATIVSIAGGGYSAQACTPTDKNCVPKGTKVRVDMSGPAIPYSIHIGSHKAGDLKSGSGEIGRDLESSGVVSFRHCAPKGAVVDGVVSSAGDACPDGLIKYKLNCAVAAEVFNADKKNNPLVLNIDSKYVSCGLTR